MFCTFINFDLHKCKRDLKRNEYINMIVLKCICYLLYVNQQSQFNLYYPIYWKLHIYTDNNTAVLNTSAFNLKSQRTNQFSVTEINKWDLCLKHKQFLLTVEVLNIR